MFWRWHSSQVELICYGLWNLKSKGKKKQQRNSKLISSHLFCTQKNRRTNFYSGQFNSCSSDISRASKRTQNRETLTLLWSLPDSQFIGISCLHQNLPETFICFGSVLWDPWVGDSRSARPLSGHTRPDSTKIVWFRQTLCYSARKIYIQFNHDYSLMLEAKETNGAKMATFPARHPVSESLGLSDLQIQFF